MSIDAVGGVPGAEGKRGRMSLYTKTLLSLSFLLITTGCSPKTPPKAGTPAPPPVAHSEAAEDLTIQPFPSGPVGVETLESDLSVEEMAKGLEEAIASKPALKLMSEIAHSENAVKQGLELPSSRLFIFGNPSIGTPLMKSHPTIGIDLPQKFLIRKEGDKTLLQYNSPQFLAKRHGIDASELESVVAALSKLSESVAQGELMIPDLNPVDPGQGFLSVKSTLSFDDTIQKLSQALAENEKLKLIAQVDHQQNAAGVDMELKPIKLFVFGNPEIGTPLMNQQPSLAIDLPQKILVYQDAQGDTQLLSNDPFYLAKRHGLLNREESLEKIKAVLMKLMEGASS